MPTCDETLKRIADMLREQTDYDGEITPETHLFNDIGFDSLDAAEFVMNLEEAFDIEVPDEQATEVKTVGQAVDLLAAVKAG